MTNSHIKTPRGDIVKSENETTHSLQQIGVMMEARSGHLTFVVFQLCSPAFVTFLAQYGETKGWTRAVFVNE
jgi:hypothetical protein